MNFGDFSYPDLEKESDRSCVIVAAAVIDGILEEILRSHIKKYSVSNSLLKSIFDMSGPISNFSSKIIICRSFGLIDEIAYHDLMIVRKLRNSFAHSSESASFLSKDTRQKVRSMYQTQEHMKTTHKEFLENNSPNKILRKNSLTEWELRTAGLIPVDKSLFITAVHSLTLHIYMCICGEREMKWTSSE